MPRRSGDPADAHRTVLLRRIEAVHGDATLDVVLDPRAGFGRHPMRDLHQHDGVWTARTGDLHVRWVGAEHAHRDRDRALRLVVRVAAGTSHDLLLEVSGGPLHAAMPPARQVWRTTGNTWDASIPDLDGHLASRDAVHACAVLRLDP